MPTDDLTRDEEIELARQVMAQQHEEDLRIGREWQRQQRRVVVIEEGECDAN